MADLTVLDLLDVSTGWDAGAEIVDCYRYRLWRIWDQTLPLVCWVMLNPSTADAITDDPTIRRCLEFSRKWDFGGIWVVNLFAYRATDPKEMLEAHAHGVDIEGPQNDRMIVQTAHECRRTIFAWGTQGHLNGRDQKVISLLSEFNPYCLGKTKDGHPKHPLYLDGSTKPVPFI